MSTTKAEANAVEFGRHVKQGGWALALLVVCSVEKGEGQGKPRRDRDEAEKISAKEFGRRAGTSADRVLRYLDAWERAYAANVVSWPAAEFTPDEVDRVELDAETLPDFGDYYDATASHNLASDKLPAYEKAAMDAGLKTGAVIRAGKNKAALSASIKADNEVARAASAALADRALDRAAERGRAVQDRARARGADVDAPMPPAKPDLPGELGVVADAMMEAGEIQDMATEVRNHLRAAKATMDVLASEHGYSGDPYTIECLTEASNLAIELAQQVMTFTLNAEVNK